MTFRPALPISNSNIFEIIARWLEVEKQKLIKTGKFTMERGKLLEVELRRCGPSIAAKVSLF